VVVFCGVVLLIFLMLSVILCLLFCGVLLLICLVLSVQNNKHNTTESTKKMSNTTPQNNKHNTTESTKKMSNRTSCCSSFLCSLLYCVCLFCGVELFIFLVLSVVLCLFVLLSRGAHLFSTLCCIVFGFFCGVMLLIFSVLSVEKMSNRTPQKNTQYNREH
jgi:flagellar basal body-associated protein FliL